MPPANFSLGLIWWVECASQVLMFSLYGCSTDKRKRVLFIQSIQEKVAGDLKYEISPKGLFFLLRVTKRPWYTNSYYNKHSLLDLFKSTDIENAVSFKYVELGWAYILKFYTINQIIFSNSMHFVEWGWAPGLSCANDKKMRTDCTMVHPRCSDLQW